MGRKNGTHRDNGTGKGRKERIMNDLISRQAAIEAAWFLHPDDRDALRDTLAKLPSAQQEIIRCKDCKHRDEKNFCEGRGWPMQLVPDDGFCDKGRGAKNEHTD